MLGPDLSFNQFFYAGNKCYCASNKYLFIFLIPTNMAKMRPKARGLAQHGGPPGWLEESDPAGVILYVMDCMAVPSAFSVPYRLP
jgi:hypothetical protein